MRRRPSLAHRHRAGNPDRVSLVYLLFSDDDSDYDAAKLTQPREVNMSEINVRDEGGLIVASAKTRLVRKAFASALCKAIEDKAEAYHGTASLMMDMSALSKATPPAALYALRRMGEIPLANIAIVGGNTFMRGMGKFVLTVSKFPSFGFFPGPEDARRWLKTRSAARKQA
jgi:hypothetical protein